MARKPRIPYPGAFHHVLSRGNGGQNRYKSIVCQEDAYLKELVRYIHLNPVRVGIVADLKKLNKENFNFADTKSQCQKNNQRRAIY